MKSLSLITGFLLILLMISCEKKIIDIIPVIQIEKDMSIEGGKNIKYFSFPSEKVAYAASDTSFIYKTTDGGNTWNQIIIEVGKRCSGLEFFDEENGMCLMGKTVYTTHNGGNTWNNIAEGNFIGISDNGIGLIADRYNRIFTSDDNANSFSQIGEIKNLHSGYEMPRICDNRFMVYAKWNKRIEGINLENGETFIDYIGSYPYGQEPKEYVFIGENGYVVGNSGLIAEIDGMISRTYYGHTYTYYSVDANDNFAICVGQKSITSNLSIGNDERWNEYYTPKGNSFKQTFFKVKISENNSFYVSGSEGTILKARL